MAYKPTLYLLSIVVLLITRMGSCVEENLYNMTMTTKLNHSYRLANVSACTPVQNPSASPVQPPSAAPVLPPSAAPAHAPSSALIASPTHAPSNSPSPSPTKATIMAPATVPAPAQAPSNSPPYSYPRNPPVYQRAAPPRACVSMCASYCKPTSPKRPCMGICTACCGKVKCVPGFNNCTNWDTIIFKCP